MLNAKFFSCSINQITIDLERLVEQEEAKLIALKEANKRKYRGCFIKKVVVNGVTVLENFQNKS